MCNKQTFHIVCAYTETIKIKLMYDAECNDKLMDFSYKLSDILNLFHRATSSPTPDVFEQLDNKCQELLSLTNYVISFMDLQEYENNAKLCCLTILIPMVDLIRKIKIQKIKHYSDQYYSVATNFENSLLRFSEFINALKIYLMDHGKNSLSHYFEVYKADISYSSPV